MDKKTEQQVIIIVKKHHPIDLGEQTSILENAVREAYLTGFHDGAEHVEDIYRH